MSNIREQNEEDLLINAIIHDLSQGNIGLADLMFWLEEVYQLSECEGINTVKALLVLTKIMYK